MNTQITVGSNNFQGPVSGGIASNNVTIGEVSGDVYFQPKIDRVALANWISVLDFSQNQSQAFERYTLGTLLWVLDAPEFIAWTKNGGMLWCSGKPGAGKTVFASFVVHHLQNLHKMDPTSVAAVSFIYCRYDATRTTLQLFEALLRQLILRCPRTDIERLQIAKDEDQRLTLTEILSIMQAIFDLVPNVYIVIDAFDECFTEQTRHEVLAHLLTLRSVKILITSRPLPSIESSMVGVPRLIILAHEADVRTYFKARTMTNPTLKKLIPRVSSADVEGKIIERASGMFLLVNLHITNLASQTNAAQLLRALDTLPKEATATYDRTMQRIRQQDGNKQRLAFHTFSWIFYAWRPLSLLELRHALAILDLDRMAEDDELDDEESIISACAGLVVINGLGGKTVNFHHYTVREYLENALDAPEFLSEADIATTCMKVLLFPGVDSIVATYPLLQYAVAAWGPLVRRCETDETVLELALSQLADASVIKILNCTRMDTRSGTYNNGDYGLGGATALHLVAMYGLARSARAFLATQTQISDAFINQRDHKGRTPLILAARNGHSEVTKILLTFSTLDINVIDRHGYTALLWAVRMGHLEVVKELCSHPFAALDLPSPSGKTLLLLASKHGHLTLIKEFLGCSNVDVNAVDKVGNTSLYLAAKNGHLEAVKELLSQPNLNVNEPNDLWQTPLCQAAQGGHVEVVDALLAHPAIDANARNSPKPAALFRAAENGHVGVVKALINWPNIDVNRHLLRRGGTALSRAAQFGHVEVVELLLTHPNIDVDIPSQTPLYLAARNGRLEVVRVLLAVPGVDVNCPDEVGLTPLCFAAEKGYLEIVKELLKHPDIDVNSKDRALGRTSFSWAAQHGQLQVVKELLAHPNVDPDSRDKRLGRTPLFWAAQGGRLEVVKFLVALPNVDINARDDKCGLTPLLCAAQTGELAVVNFLLETGKIKLPGTRKITIPSLSAFNFNFSLPSRMTASVST